MSLAATSDLAIRCACGAVRGVLRGVSPRRGIRLICYCDDCQSFLHFLDRADSILDKNGGTEIFQTSPARLRITQGAEHLACVRLRPKGLMRWHTDCCLSPIGNGLATPRVPFLGLLRTIIDIGDTGAGAASVDQVLGPIRGRVYPRFARGSDVPRGTSLVRLIGLQLFRFTPRLLAAQLGPSHRRSPFFDPTTGAPSAVPRVLSDSELEAVRRSVLGHSA